MKTRVHLALNAWLQKSDENYLGGRVLWLHDLIDTACNLVWLAIEQLIKLLILQKSANDINGMCSNLDEIHIEIDKRAKNISRVHKKVKLIQAIQKQYSTLKLDNYASILDKLEEYYFRRYYVRKNTSIKVDLLGKIDELYFLLRDYTVPEIGLGLIDEIYIQRKNQWKHPITSFQYAYYNNNSFRTRPHGRVNYLGPNGEEYSENGT